MQFKILTLNCWGVFTPLACEKRHERLAAIGEKLSEGQHDIVCLEEIWTDGDFEKMRKSLQKSYPYSHYFHSNLIGSGCCVFSRHPITETFFHRYTANGYPHRVYHGDWFGGKGVGLARIRLPDGSLAAVYVTHLHAEYDRQNDEYLSHRLAQMYELGTFVRLTCSGADCVFVCGDLNFRPDSLGLRLLLANTGLSDAWCTHDLAHLCEDKEGATCDRPGNSFSRAQPDPERIDYILYGNCAGSRLRCSNCELTLGRVPGQSYNYSDHEALQAEFQLAREVTVGGFEPDAETRRRLLQEMLPIMQRGLEVTAGHRYFYFLYFLLTLLLIYVVGLLIGPGIISGFVSCACGAALLFQLWTMIVVKKAEMRAILNCKLNAERLLSG